MTEQLAPGRFAWCKLRVKYRDLTMVDEDRSDGNWWKNLPKDDITGIFIVPIDKDGNDIHLRQTGFAISPKSTRRIGFFHYKQAMKTFGLVSGMTKNKEIGYVIGIVTSSNGDADIIRMKPDHSTEKESVNIVDMKLNLEQQGIVLSEIDGE